MPDYGKGKIYKLITDAEPSLVYVGSTIQPLYKRKHSHKSDWKRYNAGKGRYCTSFKILEVDENPEIVLIQKYPCNDKEELEMKEREYKDSIDCVNRKRPRITAEERKEWLKEYYQDNFDKIKEYRQKNKEHLSEKIPCDHCNSVVRRGDMPRHQRTKKCSSEAWYSE